MKPWHSSTYNEIQNQLVMAKITQKQVPMLKKALKGAMAILCYTGSSGIAHATALSLFMGEEVGMIYVRKEGEKCHSGNKAEYRIPRPKAGDPLPVLVFVDDFISTGSSRDRCMDQVCIALARAVEGGIKVNDQYSLNVEGNKDGKPKAIVTRVGSPVAEGAQ